MANPTAIFQMLQERLSVKLGCLRGRESACSRSDRTRPEGDKRASQRAGRSASWRHRPSREIAAARRRACRLCLAG